TAFYDVMFCLNDGRERARRPVAVTWVPETEGCNGLDAGDQEAFAEAVRHGVAAPFRQLLACVPDLGMRLQVSPLDAQFPQLARLSAPEYVAHMLAPLCGAQASVRCIDPIRYRPGQRHVLRFGSLPGSHKVLFAKLYRGD